MKYIMLLTLLLIGLLQSCETTDVLDPTERLYLEKIDHVISLEGEDQRSAFRLLSNENKALLWDNRMDIYLESDKLTKPQKELIEEFKEIISPDFYDNKSKTILSKESALAHWKVKVKTHFQKSEVIQIFTTVNGKLIIGDDKEDCNCNKAEDYCWFSDCKSADCESKYGCGLGWLRTCNGTCQD